jgi:GNAT superfamily N-acetyltransferase
MTEDYNIVYVEKPEDSVWGIIGHGLQNFNDQAAGSPRLSRLCFALQAPDGQVAGGVLAATYWDWLYIDLLWIKDELRGRGYGQQLMAQVEQEARQRGAKNAYLDTFSFQAPDFYKRLGYQVFGVLPEFPPGHQRYFFTKRL